MGPRRRTSGRPRRRPKVPSHSHLRKKGPSLRVQTYRVVASNFIEGPHTFVVRTNTPSQNRPLSLSSTHSRKDRECPGTLVVQTFPPSPRTTPRLTLSPPRRRPRDPRISSVSGGRRSVSLWPPEESPPSNVHVPPFPRLQTIPVGVSTTSSFTTPTLWSRPGL